MIDWEKAIKPLLSGSGSSLETMDALIVSHTLISNKEKILNHDEMHGNFYSLFVVLAGHSLTSCFGNIHAEDFHVIASGCKVILEYCVSCVVKYDAQSQPTAVTQNHLVLVIKALCGEYTFPRSDVITFIALIKSANTPMLVKNFSSKQRDATKSKTKATKLDVQPAVEAIDLFSVFSLPATDIDPGKDMAVVITKQNKEVVQSLSMDHNLVKTFLELPYLNRYITKHRVMMGAWKQGKFEVVGVSITEKEAVSVAKEIFQLQKNLRLLKDATEPFFSEPFNQLELLVDLDLVLGGLCAAVNVAVAVNYLQRVCPETSEINQESQLDAQHIVKDALHVCKTMTESLSKSSHFGGNVKKNFQFFALVHLLQGLDAMMHVGFLASEMFLSLGTLSANMLKELLAECNTNAWRYSVTEECPDTAAFADVTNTVTPLQQFQFLADKFPILQLMMETVSVCFGVVHGPKASPPKQVETSNQPSVPEKSNSEEAMSYYDDDDDDDEDDMEEATEESPSDGENEEPMFGVWAKKLFADESPRESKTETTLVAKSELPSLENSKPKRNKASSPESLTSLPESMHDQFLQLLCGTLKTIDDSLMVSHVPWLTQYFCTSLSDKMVGDVAAMMKAIDGDGIIISTEGISIMDFVHKILSANLFEPEKRQKLAKILLATQAEDENRLFLGPLAASVFAQHLIQQQEISKGASDGGEVVSFINSLVEHYQKCEGKEVQDVGVEMFQLVLFLFYTLTEEGQRAFLLKVATTISSLAPSNCGSLSVTRLLLLFDSLLHGFSTPSSQLLHQVKWNFHAVCGLLSAEAKPKNQSSTTRERFDTSKLMFPFTQIVKANEEAKPKEKDSKEIPSLIFPILIAKANRDDSSSKKEKSGHPVLYELLQEPGNTFDDEKRAIDAKALAIIREDAELYDKLYTACVRSLEAGSTFVATEEDTQPGQSKDHWNAVTQYTFQVTWRLLKALPPSQTFEKICESGEAQNASEFLMALYHVTSQLDEAASTSRPATTLLEAKSKASEKNVVVDDRLKQLVKLCENLVIQVAQPRTDEERGGGENAMVELASYPTTFQIMVLRCALNQIQVHLWSKFIKSIDGSDPYDAMPLIEELLTVILGLVTKHASLYRSHILRLALQEDTTSYSDSNKEALLAVMRCVDVDLKRITSGAMNIPLPLGVAQVLASWSSLRQELAGYTNTDRDTLNNFLHSHYKALSSCSHNSLDKATTISLLLLQDPLYLVCDDLVVWVRDSSSPKYSLVCDTLVPLLPDVTCTDGHHQIKQAVEKISGGPTGSDESSDTLNFYSLKGAYNILTTYINPESGIVNKTVAIKYLEYLETAMDDHSMQRALRKFFVPEDFDQPKMDDSAEKRLPDVTFKGKAAHGKGSIVDLMLTNRMLTTAEYSNQLLQFLAKLCKLANGDDPHARACLGPVCTQLCEFRLTPPEMREWVSNFDLNAVSSDGVSLRDDISSALLLLSQFVLSEHCPVDQKLALLLLEAILPVDTSPEVATASLQSMSPKFVSILATLAEAEKGGGHAKLLRYVLWWLDACAAMLDEGVNSQLMHSQKENDVTRAVSTCSTFLIYVGNLLSALKARLADVTEQPDEDSDAEDLDASYEQDGDFEEPDMDAGNEDDSSQDEEGLWNKLCTYTITQKKFMNQHWYHCHTCEMVDGVGVCTICAKVCHKGHDLSYAKFGSFFCDCGAKENKSCKALVKRVPGSDRLASGVSAFSDTSRPASSSTSASNVIPASSSTSATSQKNAESKAEQAASTAAAAAQKLQSLGASAQKTPTRTPRYVTGKPLCVEACKDELLAIRDGADPSEEDDSAPAVRGVVATLLRVLGVMRGVVHTDSYKLNSASSTLRALKAMEDLHKLQKSTSVVDTLMVPTLGSQEGAFENVKANFTGEQGQTIRQLINARYIRRVAMCCLATTTGRRQHLAVSHERTKVTLLQLSALLKQANVSKRKLTLTRLSTTAMPFSVTTITANPSNEEALAVCGLKDCHVLTFASTSAAVVPSGSVTQHLVLHPQLATNNYIIRAVWLPASPSMLALVTADFIKIYDLSKDILSPCFYLLLPTGKIRDATFIGGMQSDEQTHIAVMSSTGYIYTQMLNNESLAVHGTFYLTDVLSVSNEHLKESGGQVGGGGVSVYYSHSLKLLFFSYTNGRNFAASLDAKIEKAVNLFQIEYKASNGGSGSGRNGSNALYEWSEVVNHAGLIFSFSHSQGCPVVVMVEPDRISMQEIKGVSAKAKIQDLVAVRHAGSSAAPKEPGERTTIIVLCEDGSLRIYLASDEHTGFWLQPRLQPTTVLGLRSSGRKKQAAHSAKAADKDGEPEEVSFPIDFFEQCQVFHNNDIEFGGDPLQVYNTAQIKNRLNTTGMYIMDKSIFTVKIINKSSNMVITGLRVLVGSKGPLTAPSTFYIDHRFINLGPPITRPRWFDLPLTRAESIAYNSELLLTCGPSEHPEEHNIVDSIKVYGKTKEAFGWPQDEPAAAKTSSTQASGGSKQTSKPVATSNGSDAESDISGASQTPATSNITSTGVADEFLQSCLIALNNAFYDKFKESKELGLHEVAVLGTSDLLTEPLSSRLYLSVKCLMKKLFTNKAECYQFMDEVLVKHAAEALKNEEGDGGPLIDEDSFQRCLYHLSTIARRRPYNLTSLKLDETQQDLQIIDLEAINPEDTAPKTESVFHETLLRRIMCAFSRLLSNKPRSKLLVPSCLPGLTRVEMTVKIIIDIIHAIAASVPSTVKTANRIYYDLLSHANSRVSYAAKTALIRLLRVKSDHQARDGGASVMRSCSKSSDTPPSTRSASPPSVESAQVNQQIGNEQAAPLALGVGRGARLAQVLRNGPGSHISSHGTTGGTIYGDEDDDDEEDDDDDDDDDDNDDDEDDDGDNEDDDDDDVNENYVHLGAEDVAMAINELNDGEDVEMEANVIGDDQQFFEDMIPDGGQDVAVEYAQLFGHSEAQAADNSNRDGEQRMADSRSLAIDVMRAMAAEAENGAVNLEGHDNLENMFMRVDFPNLLPPDVDDDEAMVEYAIALSLQQQEQHDQQQQQQPAPLASNNNPPTQSESRAGGRSNTPSEDGSSSASDAGDPHPDPNPDVEDEEEELRRVAEAEDGNEERNEEQEECLEEDKERIPTCGGEQSAIGAGRLSEMRIALLTDLFQRIDEVKKVGGEKSIPYFQVLSTLISGLNLGDELHIALHRRIVTKIVEELKGEMKSQESENSIAVCTPPHEVFVVMMRLLSVMMSRSHSVPSSKEAEDSEKGEFPTTINQQTTKILAELGIKELCFNLLNTLYKEQWKGQSDAKKSLDEDAVPPASTSSLLKSVPHPHTTDMSPFFLHQYVQSHAGMIFQPYLRLITEMALNLAYQVRKTYVAGGADVASVFGADWRHLLSDFMLFAEMPSLVRRRARKLLLYITGSKDKYREERDLHALRFYMKKSRKLCEPEEEPLTEATEQEESFNRSLNLTYNDLIKLVDKMKKTCDIAESRVRNWQRHCVSDPTCLPFLLNTSVRAEENVASSTLKLLLAAVSVEAVLEKGRKLAKSSSKVLSVSSSKASKEAKSTGDAAMSRQLSRQILANISDDNLVDFFRHFLLEMNSASIRWSAHALVLNLYRNTDSQCQLRLVNTLWQLCSQAPFYGVKAAQFIDLLGYLSMNLGLKHDAAKTFTDATMQVLQRQNRILSNHQNAILYSQLANYVQFDGFFLESNPCLVCNQLETPLANIKLSSIKSDTRYTTTQQITKLVGSYAIQKVTIKVTDIKRTKMIRTAVMYYNNKRVPAIVDLKNNPSMWHRAKSITVPQGENEIRFDLPLPVVATNLMLEFTDFYENVSASIETLQCPRCSASVQANPGICSNCGENVFQCHKCRSINYDEKDPFLCNVCGFSKYAKFDISVTARQCCAVDSIENDEDRKKMVASVVTLLEKADNVYNQLNAHKPQLEALLLQISHVSSDAAPSPETIPAQKKQKGAQPVALNNAGAPPGGANASVSSSIQQLAKKYCQECKTLFEELSSIMRTVLASRSEIVGYDRRQQSAVSGVSTDAGARHVASSTGAWSQSAPDCFGCASASAQQCVTLLRVLATNEHAKPLLVESGIIRELIMYNLRRGNAKSRKQVHSLISQLVTDNSEASQQLNDLLLTRITGAIKHHGDDLPPAAVACEMQLLMSMLDVRDDLWQLRLRAVMQLFQMSVKIKSPAVVENITLPCVHMLRKMVSPANKEGPPTSSNPSIGVEAAQWMGGLPVHSFDSWAKRRGKSPARPATKSQQQAKSKTEVRDYFLMEKYAAKWKEFVLNKKKLAPQKLELSRHSFLRTMLFCPTSRSMRKAACDVITSLSKNTSRKPQVLDLLTSYLDQLGTAGEAAAEFLALYQEQIRHKQWRVYLASRGLLPLLGSLIQMEIAKLAALEEKTLNLHLQQGYALKELTELLSEMVQVQYVRQHYKSKLVGTVLNSYLSLRRLVIQRTNLVDDAQDILLELLEELTTGTESETRSFMAVCIEAIKKQDTSDLKTPQFIFERLANIIYPEENDTSEFFLSLDKDPLQEDFLQGRMVGNPYSSNEAGLGPLMRDVKNKICRDCDLIALLEDDSGMELLINNKIIALDLPVRDVYKKIWLPNHTEEDAMHVVYRMRGLLGEATEDIVERLDSDKTDQNDEEVYKLASVLSECGGLEVMLARLESVKSLLHGRQLVEVILKLLSHAIKLKVNRQYLARPQLNTLNILLGSLNLGLQAGEDGVSMVEQLLKIMGSVLQEAAADKTNPDLDTEELTGDKEKLTLLLQQIDSEFVQGHTSILQGILRIIPFLSFGDPDLMQLLIDHFISTLDFEKFDGSHSDDETIYLNCFCEIVSGIHFNASGNQLKDLMVQNKILDNATSYLNAHIPTHKKFDSEDWKAFTSRPSVPFCLRILTGLCTKHRRAQELVGEVAIPALHRLEQISSEESIGPHAENVLEALQEHPEVAKKIKEARRLTREEKKKKAMAIRQKQLGSLGMKTNDKGQVITKSAILQQISDLVEETGLTCIICREGYKFEPKKVLGIYTYTRRCPLDEFEQKARKTQGYSTVSHFNVVHYECHTSAVRMARGREEWDSALLQNTNTKCNGLLPLWGAQVPEAAFASCLARHNTYIQEATGQREPGFYSTVHDLKLLLIRFAYERSFSEETGGGGRQSNINLIPYLIHTGLYVINSTRNQGREERTVSDFLSAPVEKWLESCYEVDGPMYVASVMPFIHGSKKWNEVKITFLKRLLVVAQARKVSLTSISKLADREVKEYSVYKPYLLFWALVHLIITVQFKHVPEEGGCTVLANYIRHNDSQLIESGEKTLSIFQEEVLVCESFDEFVDVLQLHSAIECESSAFIKRTLDSLPA